MLFGRKVIGTIAYLGGVPAVFEDFTWCWGQMIAYNYEYLCMPNEFIYYDRAKVSYHSFARNSLVERMKGDWLLQLDTDHRFDPDLVARMLNKMNIHGIDVLVGVYCYKGSPNSPVLYSWTGKGYVPIAAWDEKADIFEIGSAGAGCLMVKRSVFDRIRTELKQNPFDEEFPFSEDHSFFNRLRKLGIKAYACPTIEAEHLRVEPVRLADFKPSSEMLGNRIEVGGFHGGS